MCEKLPVFPFKRWPCALCDAGQDAGTAYRVMQCLEGETLAARIEMAGGPEGPPLRLEEALQIAIQIWIALEASLLKPPTAWASFTGTSSLAT